MDTKKKCILIIFSTLIPFFAVTSSSQEADKGIVYLITLQDDIINPVSEEYIVKSIEEAEENDANGIIIRLDTPGGLLQSTRVIVKKIMNAKIPVIVYVAPSGARAGSAGVFITLAGHIAAMAPSTNIGAAHPVQIKEKRSVGDALEELIKSLGKKEEGKKAKREKPPPEPMEQKILNDTIAWVASIAKSRGRNEKWAIKAVTESVSITDKDALKENVIDLVSADVHDLLSKIDGRKVVLASGAAVLKTKDAVLKEIPKTWRMRLLSTLAHPTIAYILLMLGMYGLLFEFTHPGVGFPGIAGAICIILAFFGLHLLPTNYAGIALIVLALILFIAEIKITSYGLLTIAGIIAMFFGSLILFTSPYKFMRVSIPIILAFTLATLAVASFLATIVIRSHKRKVKTGLEGMIGDVGEIVAWDGESGKVFIHGELWDAISSESLQKGEKIKVTNAEGLKLIVTKQIKIPTHQQTNTPK